jgi:hypothetical protein
MAAQRTYGFGESDELESRRYLLFPKRTSLDAMLRISTPIQEKELIRLSLT